VLGSSNGLWSKKTFTTQSQRYLLEPVNEENLDEMAVPASTVKLDAVVEDVVTEDVLPASQQAVSKHWMQHIPLTWHK